MLRLFGCRSFPLYAMWNFFHIRYICTQIGWRTDDDAVNPPYSWRFGGNGKMVYLLRKNHPLYHVITFSARTYEWLWIISYGRTTIPKIKTLTLLKSSLVDWSNMCCIFPLSIDLFILIEVSRLVRMEQAHNFSFDPSFTAVRNSWIVYPKGTYILPKQHDLDREILIKWGPQQLKVWPAVV